jgi:hypothetical protein
MGRRSSSEGSEKRIGRWVEVRGLNGGRGVMK